MPINLILGLALGSPAVSGASWQTPGAGIDMDFAGNRIFGGASFTSALALTRASEGYAQKLDGSWQSFASGALRITDKGLLVEESRTNSIRNNSGQGAGPGVSTHWITGGLPAGVTITSSVVGTESGVDCVDITVSGTAGSTADCFVGFEGTQQIAALQTQVWTNSFFLKAISGTVPSVYCRLRERSAAGAQLAVQSSSVLTVAASSAVLGNSRQVYTGTLANASTAFVMPTIEFSLVNATSYNFTVRVGWPQCELGASATSPIRTTTTAVTRSADAISVNSSSSFVTSNASGVFLKIRPRIVSGGGTRTFMSVVMGGSDRHSFYVNASTGTFNFSTVTAGASQYFLASTSGMAADTAYKTAARWQANSAALRVPTALTSPANNTSNTQPTGTPVIWLGSLSGSSLFANGYIERVAFFLSPPSDAVLDSLVA